MDQTIAQKITVLQELAFSDPEYMKLLEEYRQFNPKVMHLLKSVSAEKAALIEDYLGLLWQMNLKLLEMAYK